MAFLEWKDEYSVNIKIFDAQHQKLVSILSELYKAMKKGKGKEALEKILTELTGYVDVHFKNEEKYMAENNFPGYIQHKKEHDALAEKTLELKSRFDKGEGIVTIEVMNFLKDWLINHINKHRQRIFFVFKF